MLPEITSKPAFLVNRCERKPVKNIIIRQLQVYRTDVSHLAFANIALYLFGPFEIKVERQTSLKNFGAAYLPVLQVEKFT